MIDAGSVVSTKEHGDVTVIEVFTLRHVLIRFNNTGYETEVSLKRLMKGDVKDPTVRPPHNRNMKYKVTLRDGTEFYAPTIYAIAEKAGVSLDTAQGMSSRKGHKSTVIEKIEKQF